MGLAGNSAPTVGSALALTGGELDEVTVPVLLLLPGELADVL